VSHGSHNIRDDIDNSKEDEISDEELADKIKARKLKDQNNRALYSFEDNAIRDVISGVQKVSKMVQYKSCASGFDLIGLKRARNKIRDLIDDQ
jgi:hypothetical protein